LSTPDNFLEAGTNPDLEEFLSALNGFLSKQDYPGDPSYLRFLEIFFRTVKANKGHLLKVSDDGDLMSVISYGIDKGFDQEFNTAHTASRGEACPLDVAFKEKDALAIVDISKDLDVPPWFLKLMNRYGFNSLVAVPLMGKTKPVGILCAYYQDVCLFDDATLQHLMMIGRMVGGATESSLAAGQAESHGEKEKVVDQFLTILTSQKIAKFEVYNLLAKLGADALRATGITCGLVSKSVDGFSLLVAAGQGINDRFISQRFVLPDLVVKKLLKENSGREIPLSDASVWGALAPVVGTVSSFICAPIEFQNKLQSAVLVWRGEGQPFEVGDEILLSRLAHISALGLNIV
jgi:GAF domain